MCYNISRMKEIRDINQINRQTTKGIRTYKVYISKVYFPKKLHSPESKMTEVYVSWKIKANSRTDAAQKIWAKYGDRLLKDMKNTGSRLPRKVSLNVNEPTAGVTGTASRLYPINVL